MDRFELEKKLVGEGFNPKSYSLADEYRDEALCLRERENKWCVFYSEKGLDSGILYFDNESDACKFFLDEMRSDPTTKIGWKSGF